MRAPGKWDGDDGWMKIQCESARVQDQKEEGNATKLQKKRI